MARIYTAVHIDRKPADLYEFVTTPGNWPQWHPSSLGVRGATDHSLAVGETVTEVFQVAKLRGEVVWTVRERDAPRRWVIDGTIVGRQNGGVITYTLRPDGDGTLFERTFVYPTPTWLFKVMDQLVVRRQVYNESALALQQLKALLETDIAHAKPTHNDYYFLNVWNLPVPVEKVWPYIINGGDYPRWWGEVYRNVTIINNQPAGQVGAKAAVVARGRLPYTLQFQSEILRAVPNKLLSLKATGDLTGMGTWRLTPVSTGMQLTFEWIVRADKPILRLLAPLFKPLLEENHRWTMRVGEAALQRELCRPQAVQTANVHSVGASS